jgi:hypothetical protein
MEFRLGRIDDLDVQADRPYMPAVADVQMVTSDRRWCFRKVRSALPAADFSVCNHRRNRGNTVLGLADSSYWTAFLVLTCPASLARGFLFLPDSTSIGLRLQQSPAPAIAPTPAIAVIPALNALHSYFRCQRQDLLRIAFLFRQQRLQQRKQFVTAHVRVLRRQFQFRHSRYLSISKYCA